MLLLILPHQLYEKKYIPKNITDIYIYEHPHYFGLGDNKYNMNKKKLILHRASMKYYYDYLKNKTKYKVNYIEFNENINIDNYYIFDPIDNILLKNNYIMLESPNFIMNKDHYKLYRNKTDKFIFTNFYMWCKNEINLYPDLTSKDKYNREIFKDNTIDIPKLPNINSDIKYINSAINYINKHFNKNYGNTENFFYPISHKNAKKWLILFLKNKLNNFGPYQDFINKDNIFMFHSILSSSINIGLINPLEIIDELKKYKNKVNINSFEGYLRQLFWREYQRYTYIYLFKDLYNGKKIKMNYFGNKKKINKKWYNGTLNIKPVDDLIKSGFDTGYIHHIGRLMVIGNFMNLYGLHPIDGFKWFMEFSIDSYEWVMCQNVFDMVFFITGGMTMRRPYSSSSNYILKMSNYKKDDWCDIWDKLYNNFITKNKKKLYKYRYFFKNL
jgi:deoxyribodipyrimidine photolyase-related protein